MRYTVFSSPEHEVLMVSYCGQWLSVVRRRASSVVRRVSTFDVYTLETTFVIFLKLGQNICFDNI